MGYSTCYGQLQHCEFRPLITHNNLDVLVRAQPTHFAICVRDCVLQYNVEVVAAVGPSLA